MMNNLLRTYNRASEEDFQEGMRWYMNAHLRADEIAKQWGLETKGVIGVIAALSPGKRWELNLEDASLLCEEFVNGARGKRLPVVGSYGMRNVLKAERCLLGDDPWKVLGGNKVRAFYACMLDPTNKEWVCIDRHAKSVAIGEPVREDGATVRNGEYEIIARHYKRLSERLGIIPNQCQAILWIVWRRLDGVLDQEDLPF
jgi:hypothetical protein